MFGGILDG
ncbi:hypothetical protein Taro_052120 [Colocasia esculenta]|uniref:Uncharacterized protein n=1 Tax=Colocasia esculenta TaxID=4460 RepID=A0A843XIW5_COLES|nr:hypothetical protein [Colocasia esculenta]